MADKKNFSRRSVWEVSAIIVLHSEAKPRLVCRGLYWSKIQGVSRTFEQQQQQQQLYYDSHIYNFTEIYIH